MKLVLPGQLIVYGLLCAVSIVQKANNLAIFFDQRIRGSIYLQLVLRWYLMLIRGANNLIKKNTWKLEKEQYVLVRCLALPALKPVLELIKCACKLFVLKMVCLAFLFVNATAEIVGTHYGRTFHSRT